MPVDVPSVDVVSAVLALAGLAIAGSSIWAAVAARGTRHELQNGMSSALGRIEARQLTQEKRLDRMESKADRAHARVNDLNDQVQQFRRENRS